MAQTELTFDDVIDAHKQAIGAFDVRVTLAPGATPEGLAQELQDIRDRQKLHRSFTEIEQERAKVARHRTTLSKVTKLCQRPLHDLTPKEYEEKLSSIFGLTDLTVDVSIELDLVFMVLCRRKKGVSLPSECEERTELVDRIVDDYKGEIHPRFIK